MKSKSSLKDSYVCRNCGKFRFSNFPHKPYPSSRTELTRLLVKVFVLISRLAFGNSVIRSPSYFSIYSVTFSMTKSLIFSIALSFCSFYLFFLEEDEEAF